MPTPFPTWDPETRAVVMVDHYDTDEIAGMLHVSASTVRRNVRDNRWPAVKLTHRIWMSGEDLARVVELCRSDPDRIPDQSEAPARIGEPVSDADLEGVR